MYLPPFTYYRKEYVHQSECYLDRFVFDVRNVVKLYNYLATMRTDYLDRPAFLDALLYEMHELHTALVHMNKAAQKVLITKTKYQLPYAGVCHDLSGRTHLSRMAIPLKAGVVSKGITTSRVQSGSVYKEYDKALTDDYRLQLGKALIKFYSAKDKAGDGVEDKAIVTCYDANALHRVNRATNDTMFNRSETSLKRTHLFDGSYASTKKTLYGRPLIGDDTLDLPKLYVRAQEFSDHIRLLIENGVGYANFKSNEPDSLNYLFCLIAELSMLKTRMDYALGTVYDNFDTYTETKGGFSDMPPMSAKRWSTRLVTIYGPDMQAPVSISNVNTELMSPLVARRQATIEVPNIVLKFNTKTMDEDLEHYKTYRAPIWWRRAATHAQEDWAENIMPMPSYRGLLVNDETISYVYRMGGFTVDDAGASKRFRNAFRTEHLWRKLKQELADETAKKRTDEHRAKLRADRKKRRKAQEQAVKDRIMQRNKMKR